MKRALYFITCALGIAFSSYAEWHIVSGNFENSEIYPGTSHNITISIPDNISKGDTVPMFMGLDGILCRAPEVLDSLETEGVIKPTVGIFLQSGLVKSASGEVLRYNRCYEFDTTTPLFSKFLASELFPAADSLMRAAGYDIVLAADPAHRTIFGLSSGGIAAFNAAWHRPDLFGNVFIGCGTFVPMRGGNNIQAIIRKHEPKALRIYLQDGYRDTWNPIFGSWYEANVEVASALDFAGYDIETFWDDSGHSVATSSAIFPDVIKHFAIDSVAVKSTGNNFLAPRLIEGSRWIPCGERLPSPTKVAVYPDSTLRAFLADDGIIHQQINIGGKWCYDEPFYYLHSYSPALPAIGGMTFDGDGYLWVVTDMGLQACDQNGRVRGIIAIPASLDVKNTTIAIAGGFITISDGTLTFCRQFNIKAPQPGVRPPSQGQG